MSEPSKRRRPVMRVAALVVLAAVAVFGTALLRHPSSPLPPQWNVFEPLDVMAPVTPLTFWKLDWAIEDRGQCLATLSAAGRMDVLEDLEVSETCGIAPRVRLSGLSAAQIDPVETSCETALRTLMWEVHGVQPAALAAYDAPVDVVRHIGSYNCRSIRGGQRWSTHATAQAIDITGFDLDTGRRIRLLSGWDGPAQDQAFLRAVRNEACVWFGTVLGPDYNRLHADHFHLQSRGWGTCR